MEEIINTAGNPPPKYLDAAKPVFVAAFQSVKYDPNNFRRIASTPVPHDNRELSVDDDEDESIGFPARDVRMGFIRRVYSILSIQLAITASIIAFVLFYEPIKHFIMTTHYFWWTCFGISTTLLFTLVCITTVRRNPKLNITLLMIFTMAISTILAGITCYYETDALLMSTGITVAVCFGLTLFSMQTKWDFTRVSGGICVLVTILLVILVVSLSVLSNLLTLIYSSLGVLVFSLYLVYDTQLMLTGKHKYSIAPEEYTLAALHLYLDILLIFMYLLQLIRKLEERK